MLAACAEYGGMPMPARELLFASPPDSPYLCSTDSAAIDAWAAQLGATTHVTVATTVSAATTVRGCVVGVGSSQRRRF